MKLIADSGGTKTEWCGVTHSEETAVISTAGLNPNFVTEEVFAGVLSSEVLPGLLYPDVEKVFFYGAGCAGTAMENKVRSAIKRVLPDAEVHVYSDLTGAARGMMGDRSGYVCMIGTGSNSGYYDGIRIVKNIPPLGFILGDEGSGAWLGKRVLADFLRGIMPSGLSEIFRKEYGPEKDEIISHVYRGVFPSRYIGEFVRFLKVYISEEYCHNLVKTGFEEFVARNLRLYPTEGKTKIAITGSVAWHFREILEDVLASNDFIIKTITKGPVKGLVRYHRTHD